MIALRDGKRCKDDMGRLFLIPWRPFWTLSWIQHHLLHWGWKLKSFSPLLPSLLMRNCLKLHLSLIIFFLQVIYWVVVKTSRNVLWNENVFHHSQKCTLYVSLHQNPWKSSFKLFHKHGWKRSTFGFKCLNQETQLKVERPQFWHVFFVYSIQWKLFFLNVF